MATISDVQKSCVQRGMPSGGATQQECDNKPLYPDLSDLMLTYLKTQNPGCDKLEDEATASSQSFPCIPDPFSLGKHGRNSTGISIEENAPFCSNLSHPRQNQQYDSSLSYTPPSSNETTFPADHKSIKCYVSQHFKPRQMWNRSACDVPKSYKAAISVLSQELLDNIDKLTTENYRYYNPRQVNDKQRVHMIITNIITEITEKFPRASTLEYLSFCEKAIHEIEKLQGINQENKVMLELGIRYTFSKQMEIFNENYVKSEVEKAKKIPLNITTFVNYIGSIVHHMNQFETRGGSYQPSNLNPLDKLLNPIKNDLNKNLEEAFDQQNLGNLPLLMQYAKYNTLIHEKLKPYKGTNLFDHLDKAANQSMIEFFYKRYEPLFKEAYKNGEALPFALSDMLAILDDGQASNHGQFELYTIGIRQQDFILSVFDSYNCEELKKQVKQNAQTEKAAIENGSMPTQTRVASRSSWAKLNIFSKAPATSALTQVNCKEQNQLSAIEELEKFLLGTVPTKPIELGCVIPEENKSGLKGNDCDKAAASSASLSHFKIQPSAPPLIDGHAKRDIPMPSDNKVRPTSFLPLSQRDFYNDSYPKASYIDLEFKHLLENGQSDEDLYDNLPQQAKQDVLSHIIDCNLFLGKLEQRVANMFERLFHANKEMVATSNIDSPIALAFSYWMWVSKNALLNRKALTPLQTQYSKLIELYHAGQHNCPTFLDTLKTLPVDEEFLYSVWELATAAKVEMSPTDYDWARNHYQDPEFVHLTVQSVERMLMRELKK